MHAEANHHGTGNGTFCDGVSRVKSANDVLTTTETGDLIGVTSQTIKNWVKAGTFPGYRVGNRIMISRAVVEEYVHRARTSLDVEDLSDGAAAALIREGRRR